MCLFETTRNTTLTTNIQGRVIPCRWRHVSHSLRILHGSTGCMNTQSTHGQRQHHVHKSKAGTTLVKIYDVIGCFWCFDLGSLSNTPSLVGDTVDLALL